MTRQRYKRHAVEAPGSEDRAARPVPAGVDAEAGEGHTGRIGSDRSRCVLSGFVGASESLPGRPRPDRKNRRCREPAGAGPQQAPSCHIDHDFLRWNSDRKRNSRSQYSTVASEDLPDCLREPLASAYTI